MNIYNKLKTTLSPLTIPHVPMSYSGNETTYTTYFEYDNKAGAYAEISKEMAREHYVQVDLWSNTLQVDLAEQIKALLGSNEFYSITSQDLTEKIDNKTMIYHTAIRAVCIDAHS